MTDLPTSKKVALKQKLYRRRFLVPNAVTVGNMFCGFLTVIYAASGRFEKASIAILIAILLDGLDGRAARRLNATSKFGVEFDSFSDLVSFGVAPALLMYNWCFRELADEYGVLVCFIYCVCAAGRLARFNISHENLKSFVGLPSPGAAAMVAAVVNFLPIINPLQIHVILGSILMLSLAYLMVSPVEFFSIKRLRLPKMRILGLVFVAATIALVWKYNQIGLLVLTSIYCLSGPVGLLLPKKKNFTDPADTEKDAVSQQKKQLEVH